MATTQLDKLLASWDKLSREYPEMQEKLLEQLGQRMEKAVRSNVRASGMRDGGAKVAGWQGYHIGSQKGYAAVRPSNSSSGPNSPGAITNYNELGHKTRRPKADSKRKGKYRPRQKVARVDGYHYYERSLPQVEAIAESGVSEIARDVVKKMEGKA